MKKLFVVFSLLYFAGCSSQSISNPPQQAQIIYNIDVTDHEDDLFHIVVFVKNLSEKNNTYNFAATAPGAYQVMDFGRYVKSFKAFDNDGNSLAVKKTSINRWEIESAYKLSKIEYIIEDTFDSEINQNTPAPMSGSGIDDKFIAINTFAVLGYFTGLQSYPSKLKIDYNPDWTIGTALNKTDEGYYFAETYDRLADSPILIGELSTAFTEVGEIDVEIYVYSPDTSIYAQKIMALADEVLQSSKDFIGYAPVDRYTFLMCLLTPEYYEKNSILAGGALEHSYSSLYVMPVAERDLPRLRSTMAHEFMHILTPLNLSSEIIHTYNFEVPTPSQHIWLYEGVTEWVSDIMQLRSGITTPKQYLKEFSTKLRINDQFDQDISLTEMSIGVYEDSIKPLFFNFYNRGAVTAALLDIRLLELSAGTRGWREVYLDLLDNYGKEKPFPEDKFFDIIVEMTYPEIEQFIEDYIKGSSPLPYVEYMNKIGFNYIGEQPSEDAQPTFGASVSVNEDRDIILIGVKEGAKEFGLRDGDVLLKVFGKEATLKTIREIVEEMFKMAVGDSYEMIILRDGEEVVITGKLLQRKSRHVFEEIENPTNEQVRLKKAWMKNLKRL